MTSLGLQRGCGIGCTTGALIGAKAFQESQVKKVRRRGCT